MENNENVIETKAEEKILEALPYNSILQAYYDISKNIGQLIFVESNSPNSNTISVARLNSDDTKQLFKITIQEVDELVLKK